MVYNDVTSWFWKGSKKTNLRCALHSHNHTHILHIAWELKWMTDTGESAVLTQNKMSVMINKLITSNGKTGLETCLRTAVWKSNRFTFKIFIFIGCNIITGWMVLNISRQHYPFPRVKMSVFILGHFTPWRWDHYISKCHGQVTRGSRKLHHWKLEAAVMLHQNLQFVTSTMLIETPLSFRTLPSKSSSTYPVRKRREQ